jgi:uncharacterized low-complexity protein
MMRWRVRLMIVIGALALAAPAFARPLGSSTVPPPAVQNGDVASDSATSKNTEGDGGEARDPAGDLDGDDWGSGDDGHFGW